MTAANRRGLASDPTGREPRDDPTQFVIGQAPAQAIAGLPLSALEEGQLRPPIEIPTTLVRIDQTSPARTHGAIVAALETDVNPQQDPSPIPFADSRPGLRMDPMLIPISRLPTPTTSNAVVLALVAALLDLEQHHDRGMVRHPKPGGAT